MTLNEQGALEALIERPLTADEMAALVPLLEARNDIAITGLVSIGRTRLVTHIITARGVRATLPIPQGARFLRLLRDVADATTVPEWLADVLAAVGVPDDVHGDYLETFACAHEWLQGAGLDLGAPTTRAMLDLIAVGNPGHRDAIETLKALGVDGDPIPLERVSAALNKAQGLMTL